MDFNPKILVLILKNLIGKLSGFWFFKLVKTLIFFGITIFFLTLLTNYFFPISTKLSYSRLVYDRDSVLVHAYLTADDKWRFETNLEDLPPEYLRSLLAKEDRFFYYHIGVNPLAVFRAVIQNIARQKRVSGASTITIQVIRLLEPRSRTWGNKIIEGFRAWQLETMLSKNEILKLYINLVSFGSNIEGVRAATFFYFQKLPQNLSAAQWALFTIIPNQPNSLRPGKNHHRIKQARNFWLKHYHQQGIVKEKDFTNALHEPVEITRVKHPALAPHLSRYLTQKNDNQTIIHATIQLKEQQKAEQIIQNYKRRISPAIKNVAACVMNNRTHEVSAYVGSHAFFEAATHGQVDGVRAYRSPGSTLKPFLYALAVEEGLITPQKKLLDLPFEDLGYQPENFDGSVSGWVTTTEALARSLNLPAVRLLVTYGQNRFVEKLGEWGFRKIAKRKKELGLSVILGGCEVSLVELVTAYSAFANQGYLYPLSWTMPAPIQKPQAVVSPGAAWIISEMLSTADRPDLPIQFGAKTLPKIAWKTGTSYGRRDAWAIGFTPEITIGVWLGNFTGDGIPDLQGNQLATPLLFDLMIAFSNQSYTAWFPRLASVVARDVCALSGEPAGSNCTQHRKSWMLEHAFPTNYCQHEQIFRISLNKKIRFCNACCPNDGFLWDTITVLPPELNSWMTSQGLSIPVIPIHNPQCSNILTEEPPKIISPSDQSTYTTLFQKDIQIKVAASPKVTTGSYYWYLDNVLIRQAASHESFFISPPAGTHSLTCQDELGNATTIQFSVVSPTVH